MRKILKEKRTKANNFIQNGLLKRGIGMIEVILAIEKKLDTPARFLTKENTIVKDGYVYVKINDIPFGDV